MPQDQKRKRHRCYYKRIAVKLLYQRLNIGFADQPFTTKYRCFLMIKNGGHGEIRTLDEAINPILP